MHRSCNIFGFLWKATCSFWQAPLSEVDSIAGVLPTAVHVAFYSEDITPGDVDQILKNMSLIAQLKEFD